MSASLKFYPEGYKAGKAYLQAPNTDLTDFNVNRNSKATYKDVDGLLKEAAINVPRYNYDEIGGCPELLTEGQSTNLLKWSNNFTESSWSEVQTGTSSPLSITPNSSISPDGNNNATRIVFDLNGGVSASDRTIIRQSLGVVLDVVQSVWLKSYSGATQKILWHVGGDESEFEVGSEWTRFSYYKNTAFCGLSLRGGVSSVDTCDILLYQYQGEEDLLPTSEIYTESAIATRLKDEIIGGGDIDAFDSDELVLEVSMRALSNILSDFGTVTISDGTANNRFRLGYLSGENKLLFSLILGGVVIYNFEPTVSDITKNSIFKLKGKTNDFGSKLDGVELDSQNSGTMASAGTFNTIELANGVGNFNLSAKTKYINVYKGISNY